MNPNPIVKVTDANREWLTRQLYALGYRRRGRQDVEAGLLAMSDRDYVIAERQFDISCVSHPLVSYTLVNSPAHMIAYLKAKGMVRPVAAPPVARPSYIEVDLENEAPF